MSGFLTKGFNRIGAVGKRIDIGKNGEPGTFRTLRLGHNHRDRN